MAQTLMLWFYRAGFYRTGFNHILEPRKSWVYCGVLCVLWLSGCSTAPTLSERSEAAQRSAEAAGLRKQLIDVDNFTLLSFQKINFPAHVLRIYIEGDGLAWVSRNRPSSNPTPINAVGLSLALADDSDNVVYLGRPCQWLPLQDQALCQPELWTHQRYSQVVVNALSEAISQILIQHFQSGARPSIELVGFSGGATLALLLAVQRNDIASVRTVAGNLSPKALTTYHNVSPLAGSLDPVDAIKLLADVPQHHYVGAKDRIVVPDVINDYWFQLPHSLCSRITTVADAGHQYPWASLWQGWLSAPVKCRFR